MSCKSCFLPWMRDPRKLLMSGKEPPALVLVSFCSISEVFGTKKKGLEGEVRWKE